MKKICLVIGTRPDAIKMAPIYHALNNEGEYDVTLVSTGQHRDLVPLALESFNIKPDIHCELTRNTGSLVSLTEELLNQLRNVFSKNRPDLVLAHGDTSSCYAAGLASFYQQIPIYHVEAGLRSHNIHSPFPEEFHRRSITMLAHHHFSPTEIEKYNLIREGVNEKYITVTGNTLHDAIHLTYDKTTKLKLLNDTEGKKIITLTLHRRENIKQLQILLNTIKSVAPKESKCLFIFPVHPNPYIKYLAIQILSNIDNIKMIEPQNYTSFLSLLNHSDLIVTDSGGIQEEAAYLGKTVYIVRDNIERSDGLNQGYTKVLGRNPDTIKKEILSYLHHYPTCTKELPLKKSTITASSIITDYIRRSLS